MERKMENEMDTLGLFKRLYRDIISQKWRIKWKKNMEPGVEGFGLLLRFRV